MSLIEAIVAVAIFAIGIAGFTFLFANVWKNNSYTYEISKASVNASQGMSTVVNYLRKARQGDDGAYPIKSAADNDLVVFSDYDRDGITERLHFYKSGNQLLMGYRKPSSGLPKTYAVGDQESVVVVNNVVNEATVPLFYYYNKDYPGDQTNNPVATPANIWDIRLVKILIKINIEKGTATDSRELRSFVELRNLNDYNRLTS